jgi:hypothetical protein
VWIHSQHNACSTVAVDCSLTVHSPTSAWSLVAIAPIVLQAKLSSLGRLEDRLHIKLSVAAELPGQMEGLARQQRAEAASMEGLRSEVRLLQAQLGKLERSQALAKSDAALATLNPTQLSHVSRPRLAQSNCRSSVTSNSCGSRHNRSRAVASAPNGLQ